MDMDTRGSCGCHGMPTTGCQDMDELEFTRGIWQAALDDDVDRITALLSKGRSPNEIDKAGYTALHYASRAGHVASIRVLLENGAEPNIKTKSGQDIPLHRACYRGNYEACKLLLEFKADPSLINCDGQTPLHKAAEGGHVDVIKLLLAHAPAIKDIADRKGRKARDIVNPALKGMFSGLP